MQNIKHIYNTGSSSIIENRQEIKEKNYISNITNNSAYIPKSIMDGHFTTRVSINGKTLFEEYPTSQTVEGQEYFNINSGDYFATKDFNSSSNIFFRQQYPNETVVSIDSKSYDSGAFSQQTSTGSGVFQNTTIPDVTGKISGDTPLDINDFFDRWDLFFNGSMVNDNQYSQYDLETGMVFTYKKDLNFTEITGENYDLYGGSFIPSQTDMYVNGDEILKNQLLELYTGVTIIETGVSSEINISKEKINNFNL